jgi:uncharacterized protein (DUF2461 family)
MKCPDCHGKGEEVAYHVSYSNGTGAFYVPMKCDRCKGSGFVDDRTPEWKALGRQMRDARVNGKPYRNLVEEAKRRGLSIVTLSRMERGVIQPVPDHLTQGDAR